MNTCLVCKTEYPTAVAQCPHCWTRPGELCRCPPDRYTASCFAHGMAGTMSLEDMKKDAARFEGMLAGAIRAASQMRGGIEKMCAADEDKKGTP